MPQGSSRIHVSSNPVEMCALVNNKYILVNFLIFFTLNPFHFISILATFELLSDKQNKNKNK